ncbi:branched-chain amino acid ABC transporter permease LivH [Treponema zuelzerae]|uniref:Branched-chain amino acid ABC transporter permease LivH n=1 Tax=Teretinema zuelzerae TaxID=156 RepID=A0AAE3JKT8_9SPIR|nr:branched-chain amino acid ABC transporter permease LivH [Teretinema zuelzerae]MBN2810819.1 branched-chain amino acid ABC transporter permease LivH [Spirochaetales bacterium]MCD1655585.1 branched-chain amino acid ABC transporter permease LivH [Teretinema zuelzerae]
MEYFLKLFLSGTAKGSIYALMALGYTMVYGIVQLINFAHGEVYMIGGFTALIVGGFLYSAGFPIYLVLLISVVVSVFFSAAFGVTIEKIAYLPLRNKPRLSALISAIGISTILQNFVLLSQTEKYLSFPSYLPELEFLAPVKGYINSTQFIILVTTTVVMLLLVFIIKFTKIGKAMRATAQDKDMAQLLGVNINQVISVTFIIGSALAAVGGVLICSYMGQINYYIGFVAGIKSFVAAVLGGIGSIPGAVLGSFILGWTESLGTGYISSDYEDAFAFVILIVILVIKPAGILGKNIKQKV